MTTRELTAAACAAAAAICAVVGALLLWGPGYALLVSAGALAGGAALLGFGGAENAPQEPVAEEPIRGEAPEVGRVQLRRVFQPGRADANVSDAG